MAVSGLSRLVTLVPPFLRLFYMRAVFYTWRREREREREGEHELSPTSQNAWKGGRRASEADERARLTQSTLYTGKFKPPLSTELFVPSVARFERC